MLKKGIGGTGINTIIKICSALSISADGLANGQIIDTNDTISSAGQSPKQTKIIEIIKSLDDQKLDAVETFLHYLNDNKK